MHDDTDTPPLSPECELLVQCLDEAGDDWRAAIDVACSRQPERAEALRARFLRLDRLGLLQEPEANGGLPERIGAYRVLRLLGSGGMGVVYLAKHETLGRLVALKVVHPGLLGTAKARERFRREALAAARLDHPGICPVYEFGDHDGAPFLAMRLVEGRSLQDLLAADRIRERRAVEIPGSASEQPPQPQILLVERVALALHAAHEAGLVHRDVKPGNLLVGEDGSPVLVDFGLAQLDDGQDGNLTRTGDQLGTPIYMSPEQVLGAPVDRRSDVYSLAVVLYECLVGRVPFEAVNRHDLQSQILRSEPPDPRKTQRAVGRDLWIVLQTALAKDPAHRYRDALAFAEDLRRVRERRPILARTPGVVRRVSQFVRRNPLAAAFVLLLASALVVTLLLLRERDVAVADASAALRTARANERAVRAIAAARTAPADALEMALAAVDEARTVETVSALHEVLAGHRERLRIDHGLVTWEADFGPDGTWFATTSDHGKVSVFSSDGSLLRATPHDLKPGAGAMPVYELDFAPDGSGRFATTSDDGSARLFGRDGEPLFVLDHRAPGNAVGGRAAESLSVYDPTVYPEVCVARFSADSCMLATSCSDRLVRVFDAASGKRIGEPLRGHHTSMVQLAWSESGLLASVDDLQNWSIDDARFEVRVWERGADGFHCVFHDELERGGRQLAFAPDGLSLAVAGRDGALHTFARAGGIWRSSGVVPHGAPLTAVAFAPDGARFATAADDGRLRLWRKDGLLLAQAAHDGPCNTIAYQGGTAASGPLRLATTSRDHTVRLFDDGLHPLLVLRGHVDLTGTARMSPDGRQLVSTSWDGTARIWQLHDSEVPRLVGHRSRVRALDLAADGRVVSAADDGTVRIWDLATGRADELAIHAAPWQMDLSDRGRLLVGCEDGVVRELELATGKELSSTPLPQSQWTLGLWLAGDRKLVVSRSAMRVLDGASDRPWAVSGHVTYALGRAPRRGLVAGAGRHLRFQVWRDDGSKFAHLLLPQRLWTISAAWSPDEQWLAAGTASGGDVWLWQVGEEADNTPVARVLAGHGGAIHDVAWSPSGRWLAAAVSDGTVHLWDVQQARRVAVLRGHGGAAVHAVVFVDDQLLLSGGADGAIQGWATEVDRAIDLARARLVRTVSVKGPGNEFDFLVVSRRFDEALAVGEAMYVDAERRRDARQLRFLAWAVVMPVRRIPPQSPDLLALAERAATRAVELSDAPDHAMLATLARVHAWKGDLERAVSLQTRSVEACADDRRAERERREAELAEYRAALQQRR